MLAEIVLCAPSVCFMTWQMESLVDELDAHPLTGQKSYLAAVVHVRVSPLPGHVFVMHVPHQWLMKWVSDVDKQCSVTGSCWRSIAASSLAFDGTEDNSESERLSSQGACGCPFPNPSA